jgi:hypothetical protein
MAIQHHHAELVNSGKGANAFAPGFAGPDLPGKQPWIYGKKRSIGRFFRGLSQN